MVFERTSENKTFITEEFPRIEFVRFIESNNLIRFNVLYKQIVVAEFSVPFVYDSALPVDKQRVATKAIPLFINDVYGNPYHKVSITQKRFDSPSIDGWPKNSMYVVDKPWSGKVQVHVESGKRNFMANLYLQYYEEERLQAWVELTLKYLLDDLHLQYSKVFGIAYKLKGELI